MNYEEYEAHKVNESDIKEKMVYQIRNSNNPLIFECLIEVNSYYDDVELEYQDLIDLLIRITGGI